MELTETNLLHLLDMNLTKLFPNLFVALRIFSSPTALVAAAEIGFGVMKRKKEKKERESLNQSRMSEKRANGLNITHANSDAEWNIHFSTTTKRLLKIKLQKYL